MSTLAMLRAGTRAWNRPMLLLAGAMVLTAMISLAGLLFDDRMLGGMPIWAKPFKFALSVVLYAVTWAWLASLATKAPRLVRRTSAGIVVLVLLEMSIIIGQVVRGRASHFNNETDLDLLLYRLMGATISAVWFLTLVLTIVLTRSRIRDAADRWAIRLGAAISLVGIGFGPVMTIPSETQAGAMRAGLKPDALGAHSVGVPDGGQAMPVLGWSTTGGDLRIPHFVGMHALQLLPLLALGLALLSTSWPVLRSELVRVRLVFVAAAGYAGLLALLAWQALRGQPLVAPDGWTLAALGVLSGGVVAGTVWACRAPVATAPRGDERAVVALGRTVRFEVCECRQVTVIPGLPGASVVGGTGNPGGAGRGCLGCAVLGWDSAGRPAGARPGVRGGLNEVGADQDSETVGA